jgi:hypothetical protein
MFRLTTGSSGDRPRSKGGKPALATALVSLMLTTLPVFAHHSFAAEYDTNKPVTLRGRFTRMDWVNPHSWIHVDVTNAHGEVVSWRCEATPPNVLFKGGWSRDSLKPGDEIVVQGFLARDGSSTVWTRTVTTAEGRTFVVHADLSSNTIENLPI